MTTAGAELPTFGNAKQALGNDIEEEAVQAAAVQPCGQQMLLLV